MARDLRDAWLFSDKLNCTVPALNGATEKPNSRETFVRTVTKSYHQSSRPGFPPFAFLFPSQAGRRLFGF